MNVTLQELSNQTLLPSSGDALSMAPSAALTPSTASSSSSPNLKLSSMNRGSTCTVEKNDRGEIGTEQSILKENKEDKQRTN